MHRSTSVIVLAGGAGTRLKSVVADRPKPLAPVRGIPFLQYLIENLYSQGARLIILSLYYQAELIETFVADWRHELEGLKIKTLREPKPLGTGGAIRFVTESMKIGTGFFVINGDTYLPTGFGEFKTQIQKFGLQNAIGLVQVEDTSRYGRVVMGPDRKILSFLEKEPDSGPGLINSGLYYLQPETLGQTSDVFSMETVVFPALVAKGTLYGLQLSTDFIDIGIPNDYHRFESFLFGK